MDNINDNVNGNTNGGSSFPFFGLFKSDEENSVKNAHESYDVYVNRDFVGKKTLIAESERIDDVIDFLKVQGVQDISAQLTGDHYVIQTGDSEHVKKILETYLENN
jgi:hypothetical protein